MDEQDRPDVQPSFSPHVVAQLKTNQPINLLLGAHPNPGSHITHNATLSTCGVAAGGAGPTGAPWRRLQNLSTHPESPLLPQISASLAPSTL